MNKFKSLAVIAAISSMTTGCASIVTGSTATVDLKTSNGEETQVTIDGQYFSAPGSVILQKTGENKILVAESDTCQGETEIPRQLEVAFFGNILIGGLLGSTTDYSTKKMWTYSDEVMISCEG